MVMVWGESGYATDYVAQKKIKVPFHPHSLHNASRFAKSVRLFRKTEK